MAEEGPYDASRDHMLAEIRSMAQAVGGGGLPSEISTAVLEAMARVPRHMFVPEELRRFAYDNRPLPISRGQTISQPYIVALMTELAEVAPGEKVLEVGTGSGYQAAVLAELGANVHTIEIVPELGRQAAALLARLGYAKVQTRIGDGYAGWPEVAPFGAIVVTAAADHIPQPLMEQLAPGGRMVIPLGEASADQHLMLVVKNPDGTVETRRFLPVAFVPLTGRH